MATLPVTFRASPLPSDFRGTPQAFMDAIVARLSLETQSQLNLFVAGNVAPTSDMGPWLKDNNTWYVWDAGSGAYVPQTIVWKSELNPYPWRGNQTAAQDIVFAAPAGPSWVDLIMTEAYDPYGVFASDEFVAPVDGFYHIDAKAGIACTTGTPTGTTITFYLKKNGFQMPNETVFDPVVDVLEGRTLSINTNIQLAAGDRIGATVSIEISGGSGTWTITQNDTYLSGFKICSLTTFD